MFLVQFAAQPFISISTLFRFRNELRKEEIETKRKRKMRKERTGRQKGLKEEMKGQRKHKWKINES